MVTMAPIKHPLSDVCKHRVDNGAMVSPAPWWPIGKTEACDRYSLSQVRVRIRLW